MYRVVKKFRFEAAHQLQGSYSRECSDCIHGHSYQVEMCLSSESLDATGMVLDFGLLKEFIDVIKKDYDHGLLLPYELAKKFVNDPHTNQDKLWAFFHTQPTAEFIAKVIYDRLCNYIRGHGGIRREVRVDAVKVNETESGAAIYNE